MVIVDVLLFLSDLGVETVTKLKLSSGVVAFEPLKVTSAVFSSGCTFSCDSLLFNCLSRANFISDTFTDGGRTSSATSRLLTRFSSSETSRFLIHFSSSETSRFLIHFSSSETSRFLSCVSSSEPLLFLFPFSCFSAGFSSTAGSALRSSTVGRGGGGGGNGISTTRSGGGVGGGVMGEEGGVGIGMGGGGAGPFSLSDDDEEVDCCVCNGGGGGALPLSREVFLCTSSFFSV